MKIKMGAAICAVMMLVCINASAASAGARDGAAPCADTAMLSVGIGQSAELPILNVGETFHAGIDGPTVAAGAMSMFSALRDTVATVSTASISSCQDYKDYNVDSANTSASDGRSPDIT
jgi:hypothetical protein